MRLLVVGNLRATRGALTLMAIRKMPYREAEEQIRYYVPARYLEFVGKLQAARRAGPRLAGRVSERVSVFVWGAREAGSVGRGRERSAGRGPRTLT
jgi:hypothetical protein